jgi:hypothetical protein
LLASHDHGFAGGQTVDDFNLARAARAHLDLHTLADLALRSINQPNDKLPPALRHDGLLGNHQRLVLLGKHSGHPREHAGPKLHSAVVDAGPHTHRPTVGVNQGINRQHHG